MLVDKLQRRQTVTNIRDDCSDVWPVPWQRALAPSASRSYGAHVLASREPRICSSKREQGIEHPTVVKP